MNIHCMSRCRSTMHGLLCIYQAPLSEEQSSSACMHIHTLHTMQMHEVHQESRDIFAISLATRTEPKSRDCSGETGTVGMYVPVNVKCLCTVNVGSSTTYTTTWYMYRHCTPWPMHHTFIQEHASYYVFHEVTKKPKN